jgi:hypothetical protein
MSDKQKNPYENYVPEYKRMRVVPTIKDTKISEVDALITQKVGKDIIMKEDDDNVYEAAPEVQQDDQQNMPPVKEGEYILMLNDGIIATGSAHTVQQILFEMLFNNVDEQLTADDFVILKRVSLKIGVFVSE